MAIILCAICMMFGCYGDYSVRYMYDVRVLTIVMEIILCVLTVLQSLLLSKMHIKPTLICVIINILTTLGFFVSQYTKLVINIIIVIINNWLP